MKLSPLLLGDNAVLNIVRCVEGAMIELVSVSESLPNDASLDRSMLESLRYSVRERMVFAVN